MNVACGFAYSVVNCDGKSKPVQKYRQGADGQKKPAETFLETILEREKELRESLKTPAPLVMAHNDWVLFNESLVVPEFLDSIGVWDKDTGKYAGQRHNKYRWATFSFIGPKMERKPKYPVDEWIEKTQSDFLFCAAPLLRKNVRNTVKDHCHVSGRFRGAAHDECNKKLRINPKKIPSPLYSTI